MKNIKEKWHNWKFSHPQRAFVVVCIIWFSLALVVSFLLFICIWFTSAKHHLFPIEAANARYMLSALAQSQAAIIAIIITLSLIAVQLAASAYSPRFITTFRANLAMWVLVGLYVFAISLDIFVLIFLKTEVRKMNQAMNQSMVSQSSILSLDSISLSHELLVSFTFCLGIVTFLALVPYMGRITALLEPVKNIERLAEDAKYKIEAQAITGEDVQPLMDVIHGAVERCQLDTARRGLNQLNEIIEEALNKDTPKENTWKSDFFTEYLSKHLKYVCKWFKRAEDEVSIINFITVLGKKGRKTVENNRNDAASYVVGLLASLGKSAADNSLKDTTQEAVASLSVVGKAAMNAAMNNGVGFKDTTGRVISALGVVINKAVTRGKDLEGVAEQAVSSIIDLATAAMTKGEDFEGIVSDSLALLSKLNNTIVENGFFLFESQNKDVEVIRLCNNLKEQLKKDPSTV